ncbi:polysaccharide deacetylase family protein [Sediminibacillus halophilus]|uniref:Peptidoglycan/xylan/chitin deacetylase, PgdA/CDA1 family n=1 Tax=Sediminibacillus halophilus TaxID=482461 RepID=A0A1G9MWT8_9BACI|nr:polysaccharide deacetylase family protein [Sediminibacillus halophilus]SDL78491.1 Peptidoglycan/xylan/chitin deacetylase, PgdA/CDA1 family [Sediminibacillus halophilus]
MKKHKILWIGIIGILFLAGCSHLSTSAGPDNKENQQTENKEDTQEKTDEDNITEEQEEQKDPGNSEEHDKETASPESGPDDRAIEPQYELTDNWSIKPIKDEAEENVVLLTIDDAPDKHALEMAKTLKDLDAKAIFFVNGHFLENEEKKKVLKKIHEMGFLIGNHTYHHQALVDATEEEQKNEIVRLNDLIEDIIGERPKFFRAPNGQNTDYSKQVAKEEGMLLMNWSYGYDWNEEYMDEEALADIMVNTELLGNGANLLMHDREWTADALEEIVSGLREKGYEIVDPGLIKTK